MALFSPWFRPIFKSASIGSAGAYPTVTFRSDLPDPTLNVGKTYLVLKFEVSTISRSGLWTSDGTWYRNGQGIFAMANFALQTVNGWLVQFSASLTASRIYTFPDKDGTFALLSDIPSTSIITTTDSTSPTIATVAVDDLTRITIKAHFIAKRTDASNSQGAAYERWGTFFRDGVGVQQEGSLYTPYSRQTPNTLNATMTISGNNVLLTVNGNVGETYDWRVYYEVLLL